LGDVVESFGRGIVCELLIVAKLDWVGSGLDMDVTSGNDMVAALLMVGIDPTIVGAVSDMMVSDSLSLDDLPCCDGVTGFGWVNCCCLLGILVCVGVTMAMTDNKYNVAVTTNMDMK